MTSPFFDYEGRVVSLLGRIDSSHVDVLADQLLRLETENSDDITLYVSCVGANLIDALKIADVMNTLQSHVTASRLMAALSSLTGRFLPLTRAGERPLLRSYPSPGCLFSSYKSEGACGGGGVSRSADRRHPDHPVSLSGAGAFLRPFLKSFLTSPLSPVRPRGGLAGRERSME